MCAVYLASGQVAADVVDRGDRCTFESPTLLRMEWSDEGIETKLRATKFPSLCERVVSLSHRSNIDESRTYHHHFTPRSTSWHFSENDQSMLCQPTRRR